MSKLRAALAGALAFALAHKSEIGAVLSWAATLPLPSPYHQAAAAIAAVAAYLAGRKYPAA